MNPSFSIITTCKGRLDHLKRSLPRMLAQKDAEVIVVDYSCPDGTGDYVEQNFPEVRVVRVEGERGFSNWRARNRGAAAASGAMLVFCDADTILTPKAVEIIARSVPKNGYGFFTRSSTARFNKKGLRLEMNQLRGFQAVPMDAFRGLGGYDEVLEGYAAGGDTDLEERLSLRGFKGITLGDGIIEDVVEHDNVARFTFHREPIKRSYAAGLLYRRAKMTVLRNRKKGLTLDDRKRMYEAALKAATSLDYGEQKVMLTINMEEAPIGMPRQLGFEKGTSVVSVTVQLNLDKKIGAPPL